MSKQIDLKKLEEKLREKIKSLRYFLIPFEYFEKEIMSVLREFGIESNYCNYFINLGEVIIEDKNIRYEVASDELSCDEVLGIIKMKRLIYQDNEDVRIDVIDVLNIYLDIEYEDDEDDDYIEDECFDEDDEDVYWEDVEESDYDVEDPEDDDP